MIRRLIFAIGLIVVTSATALAETQALAPDVHVGDMWRYRTVDGFTNETTLEYSHRLVEINDREFVIQLQNKGKQGSALRFYTHDWNSLDSGDAKFEPYFPTYKFPLKVGAELQQEYKTLMTNGQVSTGFLKTRVVAFEKVTVPAGTFDAFKEEYVTEVIDADSNATTRTGRVTIWYAPAVKNLVRRETIVLANGRVRSKEVDELVVYSLKNQPPLSR